MPEIPYGLTREDFQRMASAVRKTEGLPPRRDGQLRRPAGGMDAPHNWIVITNAAPQTITLPSGVQVTGFAAVWSYFDSSNAGWTDTLNVCWYLGANGETVTQSSRLECRLIGQDASGVPIWSSAKDNSLAWVKVNNAATGQTIYLGRSITDGVLNGTTTLTSQTASFSSNDVGDLLIGTGIPSNTTISAFVNSTTVTMSHAATTSATNVHVTIVDGVTLGFAASVQDWVQPTGVLPGQWSFAGGGGNSACWFLSANSPDPANPATVSPHNQFPFTFSSQEALLCEQVGIDVSGVPIFAWSYDPAVFFDMADSTAPGQMYVSSSSPVVVYGKTAGSVITLGNLTGVFGGLNADGTTNGWDLFVAPGPFAQQQGVSTVPYMGDTGMDSIGNQFVNGINVAVGGNTTGAVADYGTWSS